MEQDVQNEEVNEADQQPGDVPQPEMAAAQQQEENIQADGDGANGAGAQLAQQPQLDPQQPGQAQQQQPVQAQDDVNWNLMEWDRAEELTWERLLGLDGSLVFLEHVFWVASLNTLFILVFGKTTN